MAHHPAGSLGGGGRLAAAWLPRDAVRPLILVLLVLVAVYTLKRKDFGLEHRPTHAALAYFLPNGHVLPLLVVAVMIVRSAWDTLRLA